jgi:thymidylate kinase
MIIVIEGCDGAGKSTLAHTLADMFDLTVHHEGPPPADVPALEHYGALVESHRWAIARGNIKGVVFDRLALGERVYGPVYRGVDTLGADNWRIFKRVLTAADALQVYCVPPFKVCLENWLARRGQEMLQREEQLRAVFDLYNQLVIREPPPNPFFIYDYTQPGLLDRLVARVSEMHVRRYLGLPPGVIGSTYARYLLVGERGSQATSQTADLPFFGHVNSSKYLTEALDAAGYHEREMAFTNAERWDNQPVEWPKTYRTIALGEKAGMECLRREITNLVMVPHPQYWRRFHSLEIETYVEMLRIVR